MIGLQNGSVGPPPPLVGPPPLPRHGSPPSPPNPPIVHGCQSTQQISQKYSSCVPWVGSKVGTGLLTSTSQPMWSSQCCPNTPVVPGTRQAPLPGGQVK